ncbi:unnamed protein product [Dicrocoelium dendriticum]|nr:unnamed protein product [Dicrocoelium dendriticum]
MFRRRRTSATLPSIRRQGETGSVDTLPLTSTGGALRVDLSPLNIRVSGTVGGAVISSSSSSSSRSSSPPVIHPVRRSSRVETRRRTRHSTQTSTLSARSRSGANKSAEQGETSSRERWDNPTHPTCSSRHRNAVSVNSKPPILSRRRALLRSPIFRLILSPDHSPPPASVSPIQAVHSSDHSRDRSERRTQPHSSRSQADDAIQVVHIENVSDIRPSRSRTTRSGTRGASVARRLARSARTPETRLNFPTLPHDDSVNSEELHAALSAAQSGNPDGDDDCVICLDPKSNRSIVLPCMHTFCFDCIYRWLCINPSCPLCKRLAHRVIHSILSDSDFTELLVSELHAHHDNPSRRVTGLPANFDSEEDFRADDPIPGQQQSHHHFHYHLGAPPVRFLDYLDGMTRGGSARTSLFIPPILIPSDSPISRSSSGTNVIGDTRRVSYRWNPDYGSTSESRRSLLTGLVNNALRPRDSSLLDTLLLRQLVYVFDLDSVPFNEEPQLERNFTPNFLARNETHRHRLEAFVRRELRVIAPWLAYTSASNAAPTSHGQPSLIDDLDLAGPAVTSPLICGSPGFLTDTPELDRLTTRVVQHFTTVPITDVVALVELLSSFPELRPPLVPTTYMSHFASEVLQFARYVGTLEQYDSAVCLYRRRASDSMFASSETSLGSARNRRPSDPRLAVYVASACWPRLRSGFSQPQGLITHPLVNWLLQRLFVHSVSGAYHPHQLCGTGQCPLLIPDQTVVPPLTSTLCHPNCLRLASTSRALLEALPPPERLHVRSETRRMNNARSERDSHDTAPVGHMTNAELYPSRLVYQRVLSEMIDQARFSEALSSYFHEYHTRRSGAVQRNNTASEDSHIPSDSFNLPFADSLLSYLRCSQEPAELGTPSPASLTSSSVAVECPLSSRLRPALDAQSSALRRLNGLLLLFTARIPGIVDSEEDWMGELLHTPLLPVGATPRATQFIDLTSNTQHTSLSANHSRDRDTRRASFSGTDWNFLLQLPWNSLGDRSSRITAPVSVAASEHSSDPELTVTIASDSQSVTFGASHTPQFSLDSLSLGENRRRRSDSLLRPSSITETGWRDPVPPCVVISSDSSAEEEQSHERQANSPYLLTADDSEDERNAISSAHLSRASRNTSFGHESLAAMDFTSQREQKLSPSVMHPHSSPVRTETNDPSLPTVTAAPLDESASLASASNLSKLIQRDNARAAEEPMDIDERFEEGVSHNAPSITTGTKRQNDTSTSTPHIPTFGEPHYTDAPLPPKLAKMDAFLSGILKYLERTSTSRSTEPLRRLLFSRTHLGHGSPSARCARRQSRHHSRSPIRLESDNSDCEVLREYISLDSHSSSSHHSRSRSSSCQSDSSSCQSCRRNSHRSSSHTSIRPRRMLHCCCQPYKHRDHTHHHYRHHVHGSRHKIRHKHRCGRHSSRCCLRPRHHRYSRLSHRQPAVILNTHSSPILISDDGSNAPSTPNFRDLCDNAQVSEQSQELKREVILSNEDEPTTSANHRVLSPQPSTSDTTVVKHVQASSTTVPSLTSSGTEGLKISIFNPTNAHDFYRFLERFESSDAISDPFPTAPSASATEDAVNAPSGSNDEDIIPGVPTAFATNVDSLPFTPKEATTHSDQSCQSVLLNTFLEVTNVSSLKPMEGSPSDASKE